jgi:hypothetical protein
VSWKGFQSQDNASEDMVGGGGVCHFPKLNHTSRVPAYICLPAVTKGDLKMVGTGS